MTAASVITGYFNSIILTLTPVERWKAMGNFNSNFMAERWFMVSGIIAIIALMVLFIIISRKRTEMERKESDRLFMEYSKKKGLSSREQETLFNIAKKARLKRNESIFTLAAAFDRGVSEIEGGLAGSPTSGENRQLKAVVSSLREKLGFMKKASYSRGVLSRSTKSSSRQIPEGKKVIINRRHGWDLDDVEATIVKNSETELAVRLANPVKITFEEPWCVRYYFGASIWEFDTSVVSYDSEILTLKHSDSVRYINRRRFLRVPVKMPGFIAHFPFEQSLTGNGYNGRVGPVMRRDLAEESTAVWGPPKFVSAVVTELAGPGLRIESPLEVKVGERILVVLNLEQEEESVPSDSVNKSASPLIVQSIGEVRHIDPIQNGLSIAVELTGLDDTNMDELVRATNIASLRFNNKQLSDPTSENTVESIPSYMNV